MTSKRVAKLIDLSSCKAVVTGGGSGIARGSAELLASAGARVLVLDKNLSAASETAERIRKDGGSADAAECDVTNPSDVQRAFGTEPIEILLNAAGTIVRKELLETSHEEWQHILNTNLTGYFNVLKVAVPLLARARTGKGRIIQIASVTAHIGYGYPSYTAAKGGVLALTRQLAAELAPKGIRINSISPGVIETGINKDTLAQGPIRDATIGHTPLGRLGVPEDIAKTVLFLASDLGEYVTGADFLIDGGLISAINWGSAAASLQKAHEKR